MRRRIPHAGLCAAGRAPSPGFVDRPAAGATERTLRTAAEKLEKSVCVLKSAGSYALAVFGHVRSKFSQSNQVVSDLSFVDRGKPTAGMIPDDLTEEGGWYWAHPQGREGHRGDVRTPQETAGTARHAGGRDVVESGVLVGVAGTRNAAWPRSSRETFRPDGADGKAEATHREMYRVITGRPL